MAIQNLYTTYSLLRAEYTLQQVQPILDTTVASGIVTRLSANEAAGEAFPFFTSDRKLIEILSMGVKDLSSFARSGIIKGVGELPDHR